jgi:REP element-mobilizing transposase RayT
MARPWRLQYEGAIYHIMSRGVGRGKIFLTNDDYSRLLEYIENAREKFNLDIFAFVLMSNHYHMFLRTNEPNLSRTMQWIQTAYSIYYNRNHKRSGHLFQGRYKSIIVGDESYWHILSLYIHLNPLRAGIIEKLSEYKWSSYHDYVNAKKVHKWVNSEAVLEGLGSNKQDSRKEYRKLIREVSGKEKDFLENIKYGMILGSDKFVEWVQKKFIDRTEKKDAELPQKKRISDVGVIERVIEEIIHNYKIDKSTLLQRKRHIPFEARDVGMFILRTYTGLKNKEIGEIFGVSLSAVNKAALRVSIQSKTRNDIRRKVERITSSAFKV